MNKLTRYKRNQHKKLQAYLRFMLRKAVDETPYRSGIYNGYKYLKTSINITRKIPVKYVTNLDVED
jgi:hypothetical protein